jgi:hypothetical protein
LEKFADLDCSNCVMDDASLGNNGSRWWVNGTRLTLEREGICRKNYNVGIADGIRARGMFDQSLGGGSTGSNLSQLIIHYVGGGRNMEYLMRRKNKSNETYYV